MHPIVNEYRRQHIVELHARSDAQTEGIQQYFTERVRKGDLDWTQLDADASAFFADKLVALDPVKASYVHGVCIAVGATRVVEVGTSFGVSTLYLADAVETNGGGVVIATEHEQEKAAFARQSFLSAGLHELIDLKEGDLKETLRDIEGPIDFVLMDIWTEMVVPAMELISPHLREGAVVIADNTIDFAKAYSDYFDFLEQNDFWTQTLPFEGGLEFSIKR